MLSICWITEQLLYDAYMTDCKAPGNLTGQAQDPSAAVISCAKESDNLEIINVPAGSKLRHIGLGLISRTRVCVEVAVT